MNIKSRAPKAGQAGPRLARDAEHQEVAPFASAETLVVGIGASAGGLEALKKFFDALPVDTGMAFVLIQHLDPKHKSMMAGLLADHTGMTVVEATDDMPVERNHVYLIPAGVYLSIRDGTLRIATPRERHGARMPFDFFLRALADDCGPRAVCAVLSGTGTDGSIGLKAIHDKGGFVIAQDPTDAGHDGMPRSAIMTGVVDLVLPAAEIPAFLVKHRHQPRRAPEPAAAPPGNGVDSALAAIIDLLHAHTSHDFALYKEGTLLRQIQRRMAMMSFKDMGAYLNAIRTNAEELDLLANDMLINVTRFFRDEKTFEVLAETVIPELVVGQPPDRPLRIWDAGCSTGEETYSIVILLLEEIESARRNVKLQVFASDIDDQAVTIARNGLYPDSIAKDVSPTRLARFFVKEDHGYRVTRELREAVVFTTQDLLAHAPFSRLDFASCRNVLIYLRPEVQEKVLSLFHFALREGGILVLGASETIGGFGEWFEPIARKQRIFRHLGRSRPGEVVFPIAPAEGARTTTQWAPRAPRASQLNIVADIARQVLFDAHAPASVLIDAAHKSLHFFGPVDRYLTVAAGEASQDIFGMARKGLRTGLRAAIRQAEREPSRIADGGAQVERDGKAVAVHVSVEPVHADGGVFLLISFADEPKRDIGRKASLDSVGVPHVVELEQELDVTRKELEGAIRDLEIANDELTASNEEAMSVNEELQSTNEELETSKEELQSLNEELTALNSQLNETIEQQRATANDLENTMNSSDFATLFLDTRLRIRFFTPAAKAMFSVLASDIGRPLADLARLTNDSRLIADAEAVLENCVPRSCEVEGSAGTWYTRRVLPYRTRDDQVQGVVVTFADISERKAAERAIEAARSYSDSIIDTIRQPLVVLDEELRVVSASPSFYSSLAVMPEETVGRKLDAIDDGRLDVAAVQGFLERLRQSEGAVEDHPVDVDLPSRGMRSLLLSALKIRGVDLPTRHILVTIDDITEQKRANEALEAAKLLAEQANLGKSRFLAAASHDLRQPLQTLTLVQGILAKRIKDESGAKLVVKLDETLGAMSGMLNTLLDINQLEAGVVRPEVAEFSIGALLERLKTEFAYHATAKSLDWRVAMSHVRVRSDPRLLEQTLRNLLSNAIKYTERGKVLLGCRRHGAMLRIEVWDTGIGIPAGQHEAIFQEFHQLDNAARERNRGLGLGLAIVKRICDLMHHTVKVRSWPNSGSVFAIDVPIAEEQKVRPPIGQDKGELSAEAAGAILIIEDDPAVREMLEMLFEGEGHQTTSVSGTDEALALLARGAILPEVIVADYNLPGKLTGAEIVVRVREALHHEIPAVILTGDISSNTLREIRQAECVHLSKPVKVDVLMQQIDGFLAVKRRPTPRENTRPTIGTADRPQSTVFLVDDDRGQLDDTLNLLQEHGRQVEAFSSGAAFLAAPHSDNAGCLVVDALMPGMGGIELLERLKAEDRDLPAIMITGHGDVAMATRAMKAGATDFLEKPVRIEQLLASIERALERARDSAKRSAWRQNATERLARLTPREREIMDLVILGRPNKIIADELGISQRTVESHRAAVMKRTGVKSLPDLVRLVMAGG